MMMVALRPSQEADKPPGAEPAAAPSTKTRTKYGVCLLDRISGKALSNVEEDDSPPTRPMA